MGSPGSSFIPVYKRLFDYYRNKILSQQYKPGYQVDSITRIMQKHGVSRETSKLVLRMLVEERLVVSHMGKGSFVAPIAETKKIWGMIIPFYSSNLEQLINQLDQEAQARGRQLSYFIGYNNPREEERLVETMIREGYEAAIIVPNNDESLTANFYRRLFYGNTCVVLTDYTMGGSYFRYVIQSYDLGVKRALDYLTARTPKNLLLVKNNTWKGRNLLYEFMEQTFAGIVAENYPERKVYVISDMKELDNDFVSRQQIGGILCCADTDAVRCIGRLKTYGFAFPGELSLVSYGNTELTEFFDPPITVIDCMYAEMAAQTAKLIDKGGSAGPFEQYVILPRLIIRNT
ncbi:MAG: GntR family transcriptional regulator [Bacteroidales bacterium]|nr:GntR family transcriptional regulator [Bacteroidales bacterium]